MDKDGGAYCQKVVIARGEIGLDYDVREEQRDFDRTELAKMWPPASIPVLCDGDEVIGESSIIIEHVAGARLVGFTRPQLTRYYRALVHRPSFAAVISTARAYRDLFALP